MKVDSSKICNESNHMKILFNQEKTAPTLLLPNMFDLINEQMDGSDEV